MNRTARNLLAVAFLSTTLCRQGAFAAEMLDQSNVFASAISYQAADYQDLGQTFTVGLTGTLSRIEVLLAKALNPTGDVFLTVYDTSFGVPATPLGSASAPTSSVSTTTPTLISFDVSQYQISVATDEVMAFVLSNPGSGLYLAPFEEMPSHYPGGNGMYRFTPNGAWQQQRTRDYGFKTYVLTEDSGELFGDYNDDGTIDAVDYTVWRNTLESGGALQHDATPESVAAEDYDYWKSHYGESLPGAGAFQVPEPATIALLSLSLSICAASSATPLRNPQRRRG